MLYSGIGVEKEQFKRELNRKPEKVFVYQF